MRSFLLICGLLCVACLMPVQAQLRNGPDPFATDPLAQALQHDNVFVGKSLRDRIDAQALRDIAANGPAPGPVKIVVVNQLPAGGAQFGTRDLYTEALHRYLGLGQGTLLIITERGAAASTNAVPPEQITQLLQQNAETLKTEPVTGIRNVLTALNRASAAPESTPPPGVGPESARGQEVDHPGNLLWILPVGIGVGTLIWWGRKTAAMVRALEAAKAPVVRLRGEVIDGITHVDQYLDLLPESPEAIAAQAARQTAAVLLEQAAAIARSAPTPEDYGRAEALLEQALEQVAVCRRQIDAATGGTGMAVAVEGTDYKATPRTMNGAPATLAAPIRQYVHPDDIPEHERGACFFCSRPSRLSDLTPVTIMLNSQRRKVLACADDVEIIKRGATPEVRTVEANGQRVPWYASSGYDPYRDYNTTTVIYAPGYASYPYNGGFMDGLLFGAMLSNPFPMAYPVFVTPTGLPTDNFQMADPVYSDNSGPIDLVAPANADFGFDNGGSIDFGNDNAGGWDSGGSVDFGEDTAGSDFADSNSGSLDFGGFDAGGSADFGGGSSDFGGGGDSGGGGGDY